MSSIMRERATNPRYSIEETHILTEIAGELGKLSHLIAHAQRDLIADNMFHGEISIPDSELFPIIRLIGKYVDRLPSGLGRNLFTALHSALPEGK